MSRPDELIETAERVIKRASGRCDDAEVTLRHDESAGSTIRGQLSSGRAASRTLVGIRLRVGRRIGAASAALVDDVSIDRVIEQALVAAGAGALTATEDSISAAGRCVTPAFMDESPPAGSADARDRAIDLASRVRDAAEYFTIAAGASRMRVLVATTRGTLAADAVTNATAVIEARVHRKLPRAVTAHRMGAAALDTTGFAEDLVADLEAAQNVRPLERGRETIILDADTSSKIIPSVTIHASAFIVRHGLSRFAGKLGEAVLSDAFTLRDAAHGTPLGGRARTVDDEGTPTRARDIITRGRLVDLVYNAEEARLAGREGAAGNGFRGGEIVDAAPRPALVQPELLPGARPLEAIIADTRRAILVRHELLGWYHSTGVTGLMSVVAPCAFLVEDGHIVCGLPPVTLGFDAIAALADARLEIGAGPVVTPHGTSAPMVLHDIAVSG